MYMHGLVAMSLVTSTIVTLTSKAVYELAATALATTVCKGVAKDIMRLPCMMMRKSSCSRRWMHRLGHGLNWKVIAPHTQTHILVASADSSPFGIYPPTPAGLNAYQTLILKEYNSRWTTRQFGPLIRLKDSEITFMVFHKEPIEIISQGFSSKKRENRRGQNEMNGKL